MKKRSSDTLTLTETKALLGSVQSPNAFRVKRRGLLRKRFSSEYPEELRGIMSEGDYVEYLRRIDEESRYSAKANFLCVVPLAGLGLLAVLYLVSGNASVLKVGAIAWCVCFAGVLEAISVLKERRRAEADERAKAVVREINERFFALGVEWAYTGAKKMSAVFIEVTFHSAGTVGGSGSSSSSRGSRTLYSSPSGRRGGPMPLTSCPASLVLPKSRPAPEASVTIDIGDSSSSSISSSSGNSGKKARL